MVVNREYCASHSEDRLCGMNIAMDSRSVKRAKHGGYDRLISVAPCRAADHARAKTNKEGLSVRSPWVAPATATVPKRRPPADAGKTNGDRGAFTGRTADRNGSPMFLNDFFDGGETQPNT